MDPKIKRLLAEIRLEEQLYLAHHPKGYDETLYPINWQGRSWEYSECHEMFRMGYTCAEALGANGLAGGIYLFAGLVIFPDGSQIDTSK